MRVFLGLDILFFLLSFSALPVSVIVYTRNRPKWIGTYIAIQLLASLYVALDIIHTGSLSTYIDFLSYETFLTLIVILRACLLLLVPLFVHSLLSIQNGRRGVIFFAAAATIELAALPATRVEGSEFTRFSPPLLIGAVFSLLLVAYILTVAFRIHSRLDGAMKKVNGLFRFAGPLFIVYLILETTDPFYRTQLLPSGYISLTNIAYGIWNSIFLWFLLHVLSRHSDIIESPDEFRAFCRRHSLTERQKEILRLVVSGYSNKEIAFSLGIKENTVKAHLFHTYRKIGVNTRVELINRIRQR